MVYCSQCGTANKPNSKFCKNCGALLAPSTDIRCPICGTMNPHDATTCKNCGTRLTTNTSSPPNQNTPADAPETITPYNPPALPPDSETEAGNQAALGTSATTARPSFSRSSSEWLRRIQKTPPASAPASTQTPPSTAPAAMVPPPAAGGDPEWLRELQVEAARQQAQSSPAASQAAAVLGGVAALETQSEAGTAAQAPVEPPPAGVEAIAPTAQAAESPVKDGHAVAAAAVLGTAAALAQPILSETQAATPTAPVAIEMPSAAAPALSDIRITGDDYDYSDVGGQVTDEMKAQLAAQSSDVESVDDEVALARRLLGLDVAAEAISTAAPSVEASAPPAIETPVAEVATPSEPAPTVVAPEPAQAVAAESAEAVASKGTEAEAKEKPDHPILGAAAATAVLGAVANEPRQVTPALVETPSSTAPVLSDIRITGDDYDYSDVGGQVTDEMKAQLAAQSSDVESVDDEVALARRLLGLDVATEVVQANAAGAEPVAAESIASTAPASETGAPIAPEPVVSGATTAGGSPNAGMSKEAEESHPLAAVVAAGAVLHAFGGDEDANEPEAAPAAPESQTPIVAAMAQPATAEAASSSAPTEPATAEATPPVASAAQTDDDEENRLARLAAASSAAVAAAVVHQARKDDTPEVAAPPLAETTAVPASSDEPAAPAGVEATTPSLESGEMPEWLREIAPADVAAVVAASPQATEEGQLPDWVQELKPVAGVVGASALLAHLPELDDSERGDLPDWLREAPAAAKVAPTEEIAAGEPSGTEPLLDIPLILPAWMTDSGGVPSTRDPFEVVETTGPLAGVMGILPLAVAIAEPHTLTTPMPARSDGGRIFQSMLAEPLVPLAHTAAEAKTAPLFTWNHFIYLLIFLAALIPLFFPPDLAGLGLGVTNTPSAVFFDHLQNLPPGAAVLLAFDYTPGQAVELDPASRAIVNELVTKKANVIALSSNPNGATIAESMLDAAHGFQPDFNFVNLGYIPGAEAGLRNLASVWLPANYPLVSGGTWGASPLAQSVHSMDNLGLIVLLSGDDANLRTWMEQVQPRVQTGIIAATTAASDPQARNYVNAKQLQASLRGLTGAAELELLSNTPGQAVKTVDALSLVSLVLAGIIIAGNVAFLVRRNKKGNK